MKFRRGQKSEKAVAEEEEKQKQQRGGKKQRLSETEALAKLQEMDMDKPHLASLLRNEIKEAVAWRKFKDTVWALKIEMVMYFLFLGFLTCSLFIQKDARYDYQLATQVTGFLLDGEMADSVAPNLKKTFYDIGGVDDFYDWLNTVFLVSVFDRYARTFCIEQGSGNVTSCQGRGFLLGHNILVGPVRMRQVRRSEEECPVPNSISEVAYNNKCVDLSVLGGEPANKVFTRINDFSDETTKYAKTPQELHDAGAQGWMWTSADDNNLHANRGWIERFDGSGYVVDFQRANDSATHLATVAELQANGWIDAATAAITINFNVYNPMINIFQISTLYVELLPVGGAYPFADIQSCRLYRYNSSTTGALQAIFDAIVAMFVLYFLVVELYELCVNPRGYFTEFWNMLDLLVMLLFLVAMIILLVILVQFGSESIDISNAQYFPPLPYYQYWYTQANNMIGFNSFLVFFKLFKYTAFVPGLSLVTKTLARSFRSTVFFVVLFAMVIIGFAYWGYQSFGDKLEAYQSMSQSIASLLLALLGAMDYWELYVADRSMGPLFFFTFTVISIFVLLAMFFAILSEAYEAVKEEQASERIDISKQLALEWEHSGAKRLVMRMISSFSEGGADSSFIIVEPEADALLTRHDLVKVYHSYGAQIKFVYPEATTPEKWIELFDGDFQSFRSRAEQDKLNDFITRNLPSSDDEDEDEEEQEMLRRQFRAQRRQLRLIQQRLGIPKVPVKTAKVRVTPLDNVDVGEIIPYSDAAPGYSVDEDDDAYLEYGDDDTASDADEDSA